MVQAATLSGLADQLGHSRRQAAPNAQSPLGGSLAVDRRLRALAMGVTVATGRFWLAMP